MLWQLRKEWASHRPSGATSARNDPGRGEGGELQRQSSRYIAQYRHGTDDADPIEPLALMMVVVAVLGVLVRVMVVLVL